MSSIWMNPVCAGCGEAIADAAKAVAIVPCTTRAKQSWASGHPKSRGQLRVMPSKGRKNQQKPLMFHEKCFPIIEGESLMAHVWVSQKCPVCEKVVVDKSKAILIAHVTVTSAETYGPYKLGRWALRPLFGKNLPKRLYHPDAGVIVNPQQRTFDARLREALGAQDIEFISKDIGRGPGGVFVNVGAFVQGVVVVRRVYRGEASDIWDDDVVSRVVAAFGVEEP